ncbi:MAG: CAP domain-containing protein [Acetivibrio sp.]
MKKKVMLGITVLAIALTMVPMSAQASGKKNCYVGIGSCGTNIKWTGISGKGNCNIISGIPGFPVLPKPDKPIMPDAPDKPITPDKPEDNTTASLGEQVINLVNMEREKEGLLPLSMDYKVTEASNVRAVEIQSNFSHTRPDGTNFTTALKETGVSYAGAGENIAWGQKTPKEVVEGWMNSPGHRANIMNPQFSRIGVGHSKTGNGTPYWVQLFTY